MIKINMKTLKENFQILFYFVIFVFGSLLIIMPIYPDLAINSYLKIGEILSKRKAAKKQSLKTSLGLIYKNPDDINVFVDVLNCSNVQVEFSFYCDGGIFATHEQLDEYKLTPKRLLQILQERNDYTELEN